MRKKWIVLYRKKDDPTYQVFCSIVVESKVFRTHEDAANKVHRNSSVAIAVLQVQEVQEPYFYECDSE